MSRHARNARNAVESKWRSRTSPYYGGIPWLEQSFRPLMVIFAPSILKIDQPHYLQMISFLTDPAPIFLIWLLESHRRANTLHPCISTFSSASPLSSTTSAASALCTSFSITSNPHCRISRLSTSVSSTSQRLPLRYQHSHWRSDCQHWLCSLLRTCLCSYASMQSGNSFLCGFQYHTTSCVGSLLKT
jgi:hypothetical protein